MKIRKRFAVIGGMAVIIMILTGLGIAGAFGGGKSGCGPRFSPFGGGFRGAGDIPGFMLKRLDGKVKELDLTPGQQAEYDQLRARMKERMKAAKEDRKKFREIVRNELSKESPDVAALSGMMKKKIETTSLGLQNGLDLLVSFYSTLDEGQKQKVMAGFRERLAARDRCREEGE